MTKLVLRCLTDSFKFEPKTISLTNQIIIGRQVDGNSTRENGMFECRVLSKNHAIIWREDNKVFIRDTNSSNGTFVNDKRINIENDSQGASEITRGTILQFGVSVTTPDGAFHPCVICKVDLIENDTFSVPAPPTDWIIGCVKMSELENLVSAVHGGQEKVDRQLELFESNLAVWEESIKYHVQGKLKVHDLVNRINFLHDKLSLLSPEDTNTIDEKSVLEMSNKRDTLYRSEIDSALRENEDLQTIIIGYEDRVADYENELKNVRESVETANMLAEANKGIIDQKEEDNEVLKAQLENSEEIVTDLTNLVNEYKNRISELDEESAKREISLKFETVDDLSFPSTDCNLNNSDLEKEHAKSLFLSEQISLLSEAVACAYTKFAQLSHSQIDSLHNSKAGNKTVEMQTDGVVEVEQFEGIRERNVPIEKREVVSGEVASGVVESDNLKLQLNIFKGLCLILLTLLIYFLFY